VSIEGAYVIGVDVGTGSARAGVFDLAGRMLASAKTDISLHRASGSIVEQSSVDIWQAVCQSVRIAITSSGIRPEAIAGLGFDATCSLVVLGPDGTSLPVGPSEDPSRDIIVWMDHRAVEQGEWINGTGHPVLKYVGGVISPEMETPKLLAARKSARGVRHRMAVLRPLRLPDLAGDGQPRPLGLHGDLQRDLSGP
jgi:D-ribulokinase